MKFLPSTIELFTQLFGIVVMLTFKFHSKFPLENVILYSLNIVAFLMALGVHPLNFSYDDISCIQAIIRCWQFWLCAFSNNIYVNRMKIYRYKFQLGHCYNSLQRKHRTLTFCRFYQIRIQFPLICHKLYSKDFFDRFKIGKWILWSVWVNKPCFINLSIDSIVPDSSSKGVYGAS